jgi:hypothetical protein
LITQPYKQLALSDDTTLEEVSPAVAMDSVNAVQLTVTVVDLDSSSGSQVLVSVQGSNDAENWTALSDNLRIGAPGFFVMEATTSICTRYVRVRVALNSGWVSLAVTQQTMSL